MRQHGKSGDECDIRDVVVGEGRSVSRPASFDWWEQGEVFFARVAEGLADHDLDGPTLLEGWKRRTVIGHVARNADALCNLLSWARTGEESPMYPSREARDKGIADTARLGSADLLADYRSATERLAEAMHSLPDGAWSAQVRNSQGRSLPSSDIPWMRCKEVWIHAVDLESGARFSGLPDDVLVALIDDITGNWERRGDKPPIRISAGGRTWGEGPTAVAGGLPQMVGWLTGRLGAGEMQVDGPLDDPPAWL